MARTVPEILADIEVANPATDLPGLADELIDALKGVVLAPAWVDDGDGDRWSLTGTWDDGEPEYQHNTLSPRQLAEVREYGVLALGPLVLVIP